MVIDFHIGWPEGLMIAWCLLSLAINASEDGKTVKVQFPIALVRWLIFVGLLVWGGFFS